jgi:MoaA/NifB/PqqE/SkfB family radical SAM enzyme
MINYSDIERVHLEISTRCNASCPLCPRNTAGFDEDLGYPVHSMTLGEAKRIFTPAFLRQLKKILINGNFGDFLMATDGLAIVEYFVSANPRIRIEISSNAGANPKLWPLLGKIPNVTVGFAIDGLSDTHKLYRRNTEWDAVIKNASAFINAGGKAVWRMIRFDHNYHQIDACRQLSKEMGFVDFSLLDDGRDSGPVYSRQGNYLYKIGNDPAFRNTQYPTQIMIWKEWTKPGAEVAQRQEEYKKLTVKDSVDCYAKRNKEIYITATGEVYPCCWLGMYPKLNHQHPWQQDNHQVKDIAKNNNALEQSIEKAINWFNAVEESWNKKAYHEGRLFKCDNQCGVNRQLDHKFLSNF